MNIFIITYININDFIYDVNKIMIIMINVKGVFRDEFRI